MYIKVGTGDDGGSTVSLEGATDCSGIHIDRAGCDGASVANALLAVGAAVAIDGDQFLISAGWLRSRTGTLQEDPAWSESFEAMIGSAGSREPYLVAMDAIKVGDRPSEASRLPRRGKALGWITGVGLTPFGRQPGLSAVDWQATAATKALADSGRSRLEVDAVLTGYATTVGHLMPANLLSEYLGIRPQIALGVSVGGATGLAMLGQAVALVTSGQARCVLVVAGEDRASGQSRDHSINTLAQVGHLRYEVPLGANVPGYYALLASAYLHRYGLKAHDLAHIAVQMRRHAQNHPGAQYRDPIDADAVVASRPIAEPLRLLDCCPVSDGGAAFVVEEVASDPRAVAVTGVGQANRHQHLSEADFGDLGARRSAQAALTAASLDLADIDIAGVYDSFTITLALLLEEIGFAPPGEAGAMARSDAFGPRGSLPLNTHGGLLSYGHPGVAGGMAHVVEMVTQLRQEAGPRQVDRPRRAMVHADGGVLSAHVTAILDTLQEIPA